LGLRSILRLVLWLRLWVRLDVWLRSLLWLRLRPCLRLGLRLGLRPYHRLGAGKESLADGLLCSRAQQQFRSYVNRQPHTGAHRDTACE